MPPVPMKPVATPVKPAAVRPVARRLPPPPARNSIVVAPLTIKPGTLLGRLHAIKSYVDGVMIERETETLSLLLAVLSGQSCLLLGDVGAAKTRHVQAVTSLLGMRLFDVLMSESTKPDSIFGPPDVPALAAGIQRTKIEGYAPACEALFFDEIFKASGVVLNPLLWLINEHVYRNGDEGLLNCPTMAVFAASNEVPNDAAGRPIYDRFLLRHQVKYIKGPANLARLHTLAMSGPPVPPDPLTLAEIKTLRAAVLKVRVPGEIWQLMVRIRGQVSRATGVEISDRRLVKTLRVVQAHALYHGRRAAEAADLEPLANIFWDNPEEIRRVRAIVLASSGVMSGDLISYTETAESVYDKAIKTGALDAGVKRIAEICRVTAAFASQSGREVHRTVLDYGLRLKGMIEQRQDLTVTIMRDENNSIWYKLAEASAQVFTPDQLRSAGFRWRRTLGYWWIDGQPQPRVEARIEKQLGVRPKFVNLT